MKRMLSMMCVVVALAALAGCAKKGPEGKWTTSITEQNQTVRLELDLAKGGKFTQTASASGAMTMSMVQTGTWTVKDDKITLTQTSALMNGSPMGPQTMPPQDYTFKREGDSITITPPVGNPVTLTRVKG